MQRYEKSATYPLGLVADGQSMKKLLPFSQKNEYENPGDDKRDYCNGGAERRNIKASRGGVFS